MAHIPTSTSPSLLSDAQLLDATTRAVGRERHATAELLALLAELDTRRLYLGQGHSSLFTYCTQALHLSEPAAYSRITAARAVRRFPPLLTLLADGDVTLTTVSLLAGHLTDENHEALLDAARYKGKRDVERLVASLVTQPDIPFSIRKLPTPAPGGSQHRRTDRDEAKADDKSGDPRPVAGPPAQIALAVPVVAHRAPRPVVAPLASDRYLLKITLSTEAHAMLSRARDLLRHSIPNGDPAAIVDRALTALLAELERTKFASSGRPRTNKSRASRRRHVPAAVKRAVWARDRGQCAFVGPAGRCAETGFLEFHHVVPFAAGGATDTENLQLRCRAHNAYEADRYFRPNSDDGRDVGVRRRPGVSSPSTR